MKDSGLLSLEQARFFSGRPSGFVRKWVGKPRIWDGVVSLVSSQWPLPKGPLSFAGIVLIWSQSTWLGIDGAKVSPAP